MPKPILSIPQVISDKAIFRIPRIPAFNRLEPRPRTLDFTRSLRAEVRDPLWMLTRQWQMGEFQGEDAASPVTARIAYQHEPMDLVAFGANADLSKAAAYDPLKIPLETLVERERIPLTAREIAPGAAGGTGEMYSDILVAVQMGKRFLNLLKAAGLDAHYALYLTQFPLRVLPPAPAAPNAARDPQAEALALSVGGRIADGVAIWYAVERGTHDAWLNAQPGGDKAALIAIANSFHQFYADRFQRLFSQPETGAVSPWLPNHLEYAFSAAGQPDAHGEQTVLPADQFPGGRLDWYSFDTTARQVPAPEPAPAPLAEQVESFLPANVRFKGQPQPRFWEMEEGQTDFGKIETSTTGLLHLLLAEFGLIYSNDWFLLPHPMPINNLCEIQGILVDDTFGRHTFIRPAGRGPETQWQRWAMFHQTERDRGWDAGNRFYLVPAVGKTLASDPLERVNFIRDEMANMVWAVESIVPSQAGAGMSGSEGLPPPAPSAPRTTDDENVKIRYILGTTVPQNWIPFIPVHAENSVSEIRLQRARMAGGQPPRGVLLREPRSPYFVEEEEITRSGIYVERVWQRARWIGGQTFVWVGRRKSAGRGEGWSQLAFDQIVDLEVKKK